MSRATTIACLSVLVSASIPAAAVAGNLVFHQGFEVCWVDAMSKPAFLQTLESSIDGTTACIPSSSGSQSGIEYTICAISNGCGAGVNGCPVVLSAGSFAGNFNLGQFTAPGTSNNIAVPVTTSLFGACTINITDVLLAYDLDYLMQADGIDGVHAEDMQLPSVSISSYNSTNNCNPVLQGFISSYTPQAIEQAEASAALAIEPALRANTVEQSVCPLSAP